MSGEYDAYIVIESQSSGRHVLAVSLNEEDAIAFIRKYYPSHFYYVKKDEFTHRSPLGKTMEDRYYRKKITLDEPRFTQYIAIQFFKYFKDFNG